MWYVFSQLSFTLYYSIYWSSLPSATVLLALADFRKASVNIAPAHYQAKEAYIYTRYKLKPFGQCS